MGGLAAEPLVLPSVKVPALTETTPQPRSVGSGQLRVSTQRPVTQRPVAPQEVPHDPQLYWLFCRLSQNPRQLVYPGEHIVPQLIPSQVARPLLVGSRHGVQEDPHVATSMLDTQRPLQEWKPARQVAPQFMPSQVVVAAFAGNSHGAQRIPQVSIMLFGTQRVPQECRPVPQATPQVVPSQVAGPSEDVGHGVQAVPQVAGSLFDTQAIPQRW